MEGADKTVSEDITVGGMGAKMKAGLPRDIIPQAHEWRTISRWQYIMPS
jgi:hypothetical protein